MELKNRIAIITGAGSGIGRSLAMEFARNGARVVCCGRRKERLLQTVEMIRSEGGTAQAIPADVTDPGQVHDMVQATVEQFGGIDVVFNNAGSLRCIGGMFEIDPELWLDDVKVNLYGSLLVARAALPHMISRNEGIVINMNGGRSTGVSAYACSKAGVEELTRVLSRELKAIGSSVIALTAYPGFVHTEMAEYTASSPAGQKWMPWAREHLQSGKTRRPEEIARATIRAIELATPESSGKSYDPDCIFWPDRRRLSGE